MKIDLQVTDSKTDAALARLEKALERLEKVQDRLNDSLKQTATYANAAASGFGKMATGAQRASSASSRISAPPIQDPFQAQRHAQGLLSLNPGDPAALRMWNQAQRRINALDPQRQLMTAMMRTRFARNAQGGITPMPLGVDLLKFGPQLLGAAQSAGTGSIGGLGGAASTVMSIGSKLGPAGTVATAVIAAMVAMAAAVHQTAQIISGIGRQMAAGGSGVLGMSPFTRVAGIGDAGSAARGLQGALQGGYGAGFGIQAGINPVGGPFGDIDYAAKLKKALRYIAGAGSFDQARRRAEGLGIPEAANLYNTSDYTKQRIGTPLTKFSPGDMRAANDFMIAIGRFVELVVNRAGKSLAPTMERWAQALTVVTDLLAKFFDWIDKIVERIRKALGIADNGQKSAQERNTKAIDDNTRAMKEFRETLGGGPRAQRSLPSGFNGLNFGNSRDLKLGAV